MFENKRTSSKRRWPPDDVVKRSARIAGRAPRESMTPGWVGFGAAVMALFQLLNVLHAQTSNSRPDVATQAITQPPGTAAASGVLEGTATVACPSGAFDCRDRPYPVGLFIQGEQRGIPPIHVYARPRFSITLAPGTYTISSADVRGSWSLPSLRPIDVAVASGQTTHVDVRFEPGPQLPTR
jgi:hypothetical protein